MTRLSTSVMSAVEFPITFLPALKTAFEPGDGRVRVGGRQLTVIKGLLRGLALVARHILLHLTAIAVRRDRYVTPAAEAGMTGTRAGMLTAWQEVTTYLLAAEAGGVVRLRTTLRRGVLATETSLSRAHQGARRTRACVAG